MMLNLHNLMDETVPEYQSLRELTASTTRELVSQPASNNVHYSPHSRRNSPLCYVYNSERNLENGRLECYKERNGGV